MYSMQEAFDGHFKSKHNFSEFLNASASTDSDSLKFSERVVYQPREPFKAFKPWSNKRYTFLRRVKPLKTQSLASEVLAM